MNLKFTAACIVAVSIVLISCDWFQSKKPGSSNPLIGQWKLDSLSEGKDSSAGFIFSLLGPIDSAGIVFDFKKDTVIMITEESRDTSAYSWNEKEKQFIPADAAEGHYQYARLSDSTVSLTSKDSTVFFLQKK